MKNLWIVMFMLSFIVGLAPLGSIFSEEPAINEKDDPFPDSIPGQYVYYHDTRRDIYGDPKPLNRLVGILKIGGNRYILRIYDIDGARATIILGHFQKDGEYYGFEPERVNGDKDWSPFVMADVFNVLTYYGNESIGKMPAIRRGGLVVNSVWKNYGRKQINTYSPFIPFYGLNNSVVPESGETSFRAVYAGRVMANDHLFLQISDLPEIKAPPGDFTLGPATKLKAQLGGIVFELDENWKPVKGEPGGPVPHDTYWISRFSQRDSQIGVEFIRPQRGFHLKTVRELMVFMMLYNRCVVLDSVAMGEKDISFIVRDLPSNTYTRQVTHIVKFSAGEIKIVNFSAFEFVYTVNKAYFDTILSTYKGLK